jgi:hypothetical protein
MADCDRYWREPIDPSNVRRMLRELHQRPSALQAPNLAAERDPSAPRWPTVDDYLDLGVSREAAERAVRERRGR